jgi:hypothetical protein
LLGRWVLVGRSCHGLCWQMRGRLVLSRLHGSNVVLRLRHKALGPWGRHGVRRSAAGDREVLELGLRWHLRWVVRRLLLLALLRRRVSTQWCLAVGRLLLCRMLLRNLGVSRILCVRLLLSDCVLVLRCCRRPLCPLGVRCVVRQAGGAASSGVDVARNRCDALCAFVRPPSGGSPGNRKREIGQTTVASTGRLLLLLLRP